MKNRNTMFAAILFVFALLCAAAAPKAFGVVPAPDGGYPGGNTAEGQNALFSLTSGTYNTAVGLFSLRSNAEGNFNTAIGAGTLFLNTADGNTATGAAALLSNTTGTRNTANGAFSLFSNSEGDSNTATGGFALFSNTTGAFNTAHGAGALFSNTTGNGNTATGDRALLNNITGGANTALGDGAGRNATTGDGNVYIGQGMEGVAGESNHTYIRNINTTTVSGGGADFVTVDLTTGLLGHASSSRRYKEEIEPMDHASQTLFALRPVTFRYKKEIDRSQSLQYGLVAEDVAKVDPNLAIRDGKGQIESVHYNAINAMLLNEFLKEHKKVEEQRATILDLKSTVAQQRRDFETAAAQQQESFQFRFAEQERQIQALASGLQKVSAQLEMNRPAPRVATSHR